MGGLSLRERLLSDLLRILRVAAFLKGGGEMGALIRAYDWEHPRSAQRKLGRSP